MYVTLIHINEVRASTGADVKMCCTEMSVQFYFRFKRPLSVCDANM